jgi:ABC-type nitrate/sulfonate/bicarbonate transport system substrate-binding protein
MSMSQSFLQKQKNEWRIGYVRLADAAPYIIAGELGLYRKQGLKVRLSRELGWGSIESKLAYGELDAAHAPFTFPLLSLLRLSAVRCDFGAHWVTSRNGNAITLSMRLWESGVRSGSDFASEIRSARGRRVCVMGVAGRYSSHRILLRRWLEGLGLKSDKDVMIVEVPPSQALRNLKSGNLDGYCVGEPWNTLAVTQRVGWCPATSQDIAPGHPEKVLLARRALIDAYPEEYNALAKAVMEACKLLHKRGVRADLVTRLASSQYLDLPPGLIERTLTMQFEKGGDQEPGKGPLPTFSCGTNFHRVSLDDVRQAWEPLLQLAHEPAGVTDLAGAASVYRVNE